MIRARTLAGMVIAAVLLLGGGIWMNIASEPALATVKPGTFVFPGLAEHLEAAQRVEISHAEQKTVLDRTKSGWAIAERAHYPVNPAKLHSMLTGLAELRLAEPRTAQPRFWSRLGLAAPATKDGGATLVRVLDPQGKVLAALLLGNRRYPASGASSEIFVRRPNQAQTWLADGVVQADADPQTWLPRAIINIPPAKVARVLIDHQGAEPLVLQANGGKLKMTAPAPHPDLDPGKLDEVASGLSQLTLEDVRAAAAITAAPLGTSTFTTSDGLAVTVGLRPGDAKTVWVTLKIGTDANAALATRERAKRLRAKLAGWAFQIGDWSESSLLPTLDQLKAAPVTKGSAPPG